MKTVAVIGAGVSGLASIKSCLEEGLDVVCYEKTKDYGGLWRYRDEGCSVAKSTVMNTSKEMGSFSDFPPPESFPYYMPHKSMIRYLEMYAEKFKLDSKMRFLHEVIKISKADDYDETGKWIVKVKDIQNNYIFERTYEGVMVCIGHHDSPHIPSFPGLNEYKGNVVHTRNYKAPEGCEGKPALVIGVGNSGLDAAVDLSDTAKQVYICARGCFWVLPRLTSNETPGDAAYRRRPIFAFQYKLPYFILEFFARLLLTQDLDQVSYNRKPSDQILRYVPLINDLFVNKLKSGKVKLKGPIKRFTTNGVIFEGEEEVTAIDLVVFATGYDVNLPMIDTDIIDTRNEKFELYKFIFPPQLPHFTLGLIGFVQPFGAVFPIFELQARVFALMNTNRLRKPSIKEMIEDVKNTKPLNASGRWQALKVEWIHYLDVLSTMADVRPNFVKLFFTDPILFWKCYFGPCLPYQYRLKGPNSWEPARDRILEYSDVSMKNTNVKSNSFNVFAYVAIVSLLALLFVAVI